MFFGQSTIQLSDVNPSLLNTRYGLVTIISISFFCGYLANQMFSVKNKLAWLLAIIILTSKISMWAPDNAKSNLVIAEGINQQHLPQSIEASVIADYLKENYKEGFILMSETYYWPYTRARLKLIDYITNSSVGWLEALTEPNRYAKWVIFDTKNINDLVTINQRDNPRFYDKYSIVLNNNGLQLYLAEAKDSSYSIDSSSDGISIVRNWPIYGPNPRYTFKEDLEGWEISKMDENKAISISWSGREFLDEAGSIRFGIEANIDSLPAVAAIEVNMQQNPPPQSNGIFDLSNKTIYAYVFCPIGLQPPAELEQNYLTLNVWDDKGKRAWSPPTVVIADRWNRIALPLGKCLPNTQCSDPEFNPEKIIKVGIEIKLNQAYDGFAFLDYVGFPAEQKK